ncbi:MAG TPA: hypothetical protein VHP38_08200, partial [Ruminiclostridium sp.]|nr:hypothetical protein [Ruminiclostridium sp.]
MMLFLCSHNNVNLFDWLNESSLVEQPFMLKKISSTQLDLSAFAKKEAISINYYKYLAIDLSTVVNDSETFKLAIQSIHIMNPKIRFLYIDIGSKSALQEVLKTFGDVPVLTENPEENMSRFKTQVTAGLQYTHQFIDTEKENQDNTVVDSNITTYINEDQKGETKREYLFKYQKVMIAVINAYQRAGATTLSINMAVWLKSIGATVAWVELNSGLDHFEQIRNSTPGFTIVNENRFEREGVIYLKGEIPDEGMNFVVSDMSRVIQDESSQEALGFTENCNVVVLCGTSKPYELQEIKEKILLLDKHGCNRIYLCLAFTPEHEKAQLIDMFGTKHVSVYFTEYTPDVFSLNVNKDMFKRILQEYIEEK